MGTAPFAGRISATPRVEVCHILQGLCEHRGVYREACTEFQCFGCATYTGSFESVRLRPDEREIDRRNLDRDMNRVPLEAREETSTVT